MAAPAKALFILLAGTVTLFACEASVAQRNDPARTVVASRAMTFCSVQAESTRSEEQSRDERIRRLIAFIDGARAASPQLVATYFDFAQGRSATLSSRQACTEAPPISDGVKRAAELHGFRLDQRFEPEVIVPNAPNDSSYLPNVLRQTSERYSQLEDCTIALSFSAARSAEDDMEFYNALGVAKDRYGIPLLFWAQDNDTLYVTTYRQCAHPEGLIAALQMIVRQNYRGSVEITGRVPLDAQEMQRVYSVRM